MTPCHCREHCRYPTVGDPAIRELHRIAHVGFALFLAERADAVGFTPPSPSALVVMAAQEWDVPARCPRREHATLPRHPQHAT